MDPGYLASLSPISLDRHSTRSVLSEIDSPETDLPDYKTNATDQPEP
jgi:hypothetical protein